MVVIGDNTVSKIVKLQANSLNAEVIANFHFRNTMVIKVSEIEDDVIIVNPAIDSIYAQFDNRLINNITT